MSDVRLTSFPIEFSLPHRTIAVRAREGKSPGLFWLGGFKSDMKGTKAEALDRWAEKEGRACVRFDYSGHGESGGILPTGQSACGWRKVSPSICALRKARRC